MIEILEIQKISQTDLERSFIVAPLVCALPNLEHLALNLPYGKISHPLHPMEPISSIPKTESGALSWLKRKVKLVYPKNKVIPAIGAALCSPATPDPTPPGSYFDSRKSVVGSGLSVRYTAPIAGIFKNTFYIHSNKSKKHQKPCLRYFSDGIGLFGVSVTFLGSSFEKILGPANITFAVDIGRLL